MAEYIDDVRKYEPNADEDVVNKIVKRLGIALRNRDSRSVSCSSESELKTVRTNWCEKRLELDEGKAQDTIEAVCERMKGVNTKSRVTFYYLCAVESGTLDTVRNL